MRDAYFVILDYVATFLGWIIVYAVVIRGSHLQYIIASNPSMLGPENFNNKCSMIKKHLHPHGAIGAMESNFKSGIV